MADEQVITPPKDISLMRRLSAALGDPPLVEVSDGMTVGDGLIELAIEKLTAAAVAVPDGWKLVPEWPTSEWIGAVADDGYADCDVAQLIASILSHAPAAVVVSDVNDARAADAEPLHITHGPLMRHAASLLRLRKPVLPDFESVAAELEHAVDGYPTPSGEPSSEWMEVAQLAAAPKPPVAAPADPMDWPLPCDVKVGHGTIGKGCKLRTLVTRMQVLYDMATAPQPAPSEPVLIDGIAYDTPAPVAAELLRLHIEAHQPAPVAQGDALTASEADQLEKVITDFEECGETDVPDAALRRFADMGYLECVHYNALPSAHKAIDAARGQAKEGASDGQPT